MSPPIGNDILSFAHGHANAYCQRMLTYEAANHAAWWDDDAARSEASSADPGMAYSRRVEDLLGNPHIQGFIVTCETNCRAEIVLAAYRPAKDGRRVEFPL